MQKTVVGLKSRQFVDPEQILKGIPVEPEMSVVDLGCGNGHFAVAAGQLVGSKGRVEAIDILEEALAQTATLARLHGIQNVSTSSCNLEDLGSCKLPSQEHDLAILSGILHQSKDRAGILREAYRLLRTGGKIIVVEWNKDSPIGPEVSDRLDIFETRKLLEASGFRPVKDLPAGSFHYAVLYSK